MTVQNPTRRLATVDFSRRTAICLMLLAFMGLCCLPAVAWAADDKTKADNNKTEEPVIPPPEDVELETTDGLTLQMRFFPGTKGEETVPVIILHHWKGEAADYEDLALYLQSKGHAIAIPDLRGHGATTTATRPGSTTQITLDPDRFKSSDIYNMIRYDVEAVKQFLLAKNNAKELNIEKLCVIGVEFGTLVALNWAIIDWNWKDLATMKQGKDVKALVLISPETAMRGLSVKSAMNNANIRTQISMLIIVGGEDRRYSAYAKRIHGTLYRYHPDPPPDQVQKLQSLFLVEHPTKLQGLKLLEEPEFETYQMISDFIKARLVKKKFEWKKRVKP